LDSRRNASRPDFAAVLVERSAAPATPGRAAGATRLRLALEPASLGELVIELLMRGSQLQGRVMTGSEAARDLILAHLDELRDALDRQGIQVGDLQVSVDPSFGEGREAASEPGPGRPSGTSEDASGYRLRSIRIQTLDLLA